MQEYVDFLAAQFPYDRLDAEDLARLARRVEVEFFPPGATIVHANGPQLDHLYVVRTGAVHIVDGGQVIDELGPGDTFGHVSLLSGLPPQLSAVSVRETLCYRIPDPRGLVHDVERLTFPRGGSPGSRPRPTALSMDNALRPVADFMRAPLWCEASTPIREAALLMGEQNQSCVLFESTRGIGIMTDSDCRRSVATGRVPPDAPVSAIATVPARGVLTTTATSEAFVEMVMHGVHHLVVLDSAGRPVGVTRVFDLSSAEIRDPLVIRAAIDRAGTLDELGEASALLQPTAVELFEAGLPAQRAGALLGAVVEAIVSKCVRLEPEFAEGTSSRDARASWLVLGSLARSEPLPRSDVDTGLVWETTQDDEGPVRQALLGAAERGIQDFERCGLRRCADGANATNPLFNRSKDAWIASARRWIDAPDRQGALLLSGMLADSRAITGLPLGRALSEDINRLAITRAFLQRMLNEALAARPPTGFVRDFVVEANGRHRGQLDLKRGGLRPVVSLGRWIAITTRMPATSTDERLRRGAEVGLLTQDEADTLRGGYREMFELLYAREVLAIQDAAAVSTYLDPRDLDSLTRRHLRESFRAIAKVQARLEGAWVSRIR